VVEPLDLARRPATSTFHGTRVAIPRGGSDWLVGWWLVDGGCWLVVGGWWLWLVVVVGGWWLWLVVGGWWL
jgi:hypothetical protein